jgi:hypothetical protein
VEPVFNKVEGTGGAPNVVGILQIANTIQTRFGIEPAWTAQPGDRFAYVAGCDRGNAIVELFLGLGRQFERWSSFHSSSWFLP